LTNSFSKRCTVPVQAKCQYESQIAVPGKKKLQNFKDTKGISINFVSILVGYVQEF
jgi:hypothetical protein